MQALKPDARLYCHNPSCKFAEEAWKFRAFGGDDVVYTCPKCNTNAFPNNPFVVTEPKPNSKETPIVNQPTHPSPRHPLNFIIGDLEKHTIKVIPEARVPEEGDNVDIMLPMLTNDEIETLARRPRRDFQANLELMVQCLGEGTLPYDPTINAWLKNFGIDLLGEEDPEREEIGPGVNAPEDIDDEGVPEDVQDMIVNGSYQTIFTAGFQAGVLFALNNQDQLIPKIVTQNAETIPDTREDFFDDEVPAPATNEKPQEAVVLTPEKKAALQRKMAMVRAKMAAAGKK